MLGCKEISNTDGMLCGSQCWISHLGTFRLHRAAGRRGLDPRPPKIIMYFCLYLCLVGDFRKMFEAVKGCTVIVGLGVCKFSIRSWWEHTLILHHPTRIHTESNREKTFHKNCTQLVPNVAIKINRHLIKGR